MSNLAMVHVGFAVKKAGRVHLMHASTVSVEVEISPKPLIKGLLEGIKSQSGIREGRLADFLRISSFQKLFGIGREE